MSWMSKHKTVGRAAVLTLLLVAIMGPWTSSADGTPPAEWCSDPLILREDGTCERLVSGGEILAFVPIAFFSMSAQLVRGEADLTNRAGEFLGFYLFVVLVLVLVLPFFSTLFLILRGESRLRRAFHLTAWGLAAVLSILLLVASYRWVGLGSTLWGAWLYAGLAAVTVVGEVLVARSPGSDLHRP
jgi:hypothetical protein